MRDMYSLSDPRMCKEYIVVATTGLDKLFKAVKINKTKDGILLFQKIKGIQQANPDPAKQLQYCRELAFFYVRIFQIYAAIALSIMDSDIPDADPTLISRESRLDRRGVVFIDPDEGFKGFKQRRSSWRLPGVFGQRGGEIPVDAPSNQYLPDTATPYNILNRFLIPVTDTKSNMRMKRPGSRGEYSVYITQASIYAFDISGNRTGTTLPGSKPRVIYKSDEADMTIEGTDNIKVILSNFKINGRTVNEERLRNFTLANINDEFLEEIQSIFGDLNERAAPTTFSAVDFLSSKRLITSRKDTTRIEGSNTVYVVNPIGSLGNTLDIVYQGSYKYDEQSRRIRIYTGLTIDEEPGRDGLKQYRLRVMLNDLRTEPSDLISNMALPYSSDGDVRSITKLFSDDRIPIDKDGRTIGGFLDRTFKNMLSEKDEFVTRDGIYQTREGLPEPLDSDSIPEAMRIKSIWKALAKKPAVTAHCKARALQLLNLAAIKGVDRDAYSSMCLTKFPYAKDGSLPPAGQPITQEYGIKALAMLFVDMMENGNPKITNTPEYRQFRLKFKEYFERADLTGSERAPSDFNEIGEKLMPGICERHTGDQVMVGDAVSTLRQKARQLFNRQAVHVRNSLQILFKLFDERSIRRGDFNLSQYVENEGMQAIDRIAEDTRNMLVEYYGDCEQTYKEGLFVMYNKHQANPDSIDYRAV